MNLQRITSRLQGNWWQSLLPRGTEKHSCRHGKVHTLLKSLNSKAHACTTLLKELLLRKKSFYFYLVCIIYGYVDMCAITFKCKASWRSQGLTSNYFGRWNFSLNLEDRASSRMAVTESLGRHVLPCAIAHMTASNLDRGPHD